MNAPRVHYANARLVDPARDLDAPGGLVTEGERILDAGESLFRSGSVADANVIDCEGHALAPGIVDMRVFIGEPGERHKESFGSGSRAAAAGGVTTIVAQPDTSPPLDEPEILEFVLRRSATASRVRVSPMAALTKRREGREMTEYGFLLDAGAVAFTDADRAITDTTVFRRCLSYAHSLDALVVHHIQEPFLSAEGCATESLFSSRLGIPAIPTLAETMQLERDLRLVELTGTQYHADQISTAQALEPLRRAKDAGLPVTAGVSAAHLALNELDIADYRTFCKIVPPLRSETDRAAVEDAIAEGLIDVIVSSHRPQDEESKRQPYELAEPGAVGLETLLPVSLRLFHEDRISLPKIFDMISLTPSKLLGLETGRLDANSPADLVLFNPNALWVLDRYDLHSKSKNSPFDEMTLHGRALRTIVGGETVYDRNSDEGRTAA